MYDLASMNENRIAIVDLADELQVHKQRIFKLLRRLGIQTSQRREPDRGNQNVATISVADASTIRQEIIKYAANTENGSTAVLSDDSGFFYIIQLEPDHDPGRFKVGFTTDLEGRIQKHRCSAPFAKYLQSWPCRRVWERAAIDCTTSECEQLHTEVFRTASTDSVISKAAAFFSVMPRLPNVEGEAEAVAAE
jgi:hypothetical protein